jgi:hypothetical protein
MGVMECMRRGCRNILSEFYSYKLGYLCRECYEEGRTQAFAPETFIHLPKNASKITNHSFEEEYKEQNVYEK